MGENGSLDLPQCGPREGTEDHYQKQSNNSRVHQALERRGVRELPKSRMPSIAECNPSQAFHVERPLPAASRGARPRRSGDKTSLPSYIKIAKMLALQTRKNGCIGLSQPGLLWDIWREPAAGTTATERIDHGAAARPSAFGCLRLRVQ